MYILEAGTAKLGGAATHDVRGARRGRRRGWPECRETSGASSSLLVYTYTLLMDPLFRPAAGVLQEDA
jgi:hypothetical protein